jgi:hypothetical protein
MTLKVNDRVLVNTRAIGSLGHYRGRAGTVTSDTGGPCFPYTVRLDDGTDVWPCGAGELDLIQETTDWKAIAEQHARQRDEAMGQRDEWERKAGVAKAAWDSSQRNAKEAAEAADAMQAERDLAMAQRDAAQGDASRYYAEIGRLQVCNRRGNEAQQRLRQDHRTALDERDAELLAVRRQSEELAVLYGKARLDLDKAQRKFAEQVEVTKVIARMYSDTLVERDAARSKPESYDKGYAPHELRD